MALWEFLARASRSWSPLLNKHLKSNHLHFCVYQTPQTVQFMPTATLLGVFWGATINFVLCDLTIATGCGLESACSSTTARSWLVPPQCPFRDHTTLRAFAQCGPCHFACQTTESCGSPHPPPHTSPGVVLETHKPLCPL